MYRTAHSPADRVRAGSEFLTRLERMSPEQRRRFSRRRFTPHQRATWAARYPEEVPLINGEFEWIALASADLD